jgi:hypothetical protein
LKSKELVSSLPTSCSAAMTGFHIVI